MSHDGPIPSGVGPVLLRVGDKVKCHLGLSWVDGRIGIIKQLDVTSSDGIRGHLLQIPGNGVTIVEPEFLELVQS